MCPQSFITLRLNTVLCDDWQQSQLATEGTAHFGTASFIYKWAENQKGAPMELQISDLKYKESL